MTNWQTYFGFSEFQPDQMLPNFLIESALLEGFTDQSENFDLSFLPVFRGKWKP